MVANSIISKYIYTHKCSGRCQIVESENTNEERERWYTIFLQVLFPFLIAGLGMVAAGVVLDKVQV